MLLGDLSRGDLEALGEGLVVDLLDVGLGALLVPESAPDLEERLLSPVEGGDLQEEELLDALGLPDVLHADLERTGDDTADLGKTELHESLHIESCRTVIGR